MNSLPKEHEISASRRLPVAGHQVVAICQGFRCLAFIDAQGVWRNVGKAEELKDVKGWVEFAETLTDIVRRQERDAAA